LINIARLEEHLLLEQQSQPDSGRQSEPEQPAALTTSPPQAIF